MGNKRTARKNRSANPAEGGLPRSLGEFLGIALLAVGGLMLGGLLSYQAGTGDLMGPVGRIVASALYASFGMAGYIVTMGVLAVGVKALLGRRMEIGPGEGLGFAIATLAGCVLLHITFDTYRVHGYTAGGLTGELVGEVFLGLFSRAGTYLVAMAVMVLGLIASTPLSTRHIASFTHVVMDGARSSAAYLWEGLVGLVKAQRDAVAEARGSGPWLASDVAEEEEEEGEEWEEEDEDGEEEWEEEDDEWEEDEDEEWEEEEEEEDKPRKKSRAKARPKAKAGKARARDAAATDNLEGFDESESIETDVGAPANGKPGKKPTRKVAPAPAAEDLPEIVVPEEEPANRAPTKKAPPRPDQLPRPAPAAAAAPAKPKDALPGVISLTDAPFQLPALKLFEAAEKVHGEVDRKFVLEQAERLVNALAEFKIRGKVTKIHPGPVITRYEFKPEAGVKLSKIESLESDIAMALEAIRIRILAPIPGKATVGFEVPNKVRETVYIKEIVGEDGFGGGQKLPLALGKDIVGKSRWIDLAKAPHLLVAGATGSGKSVGVNSMISSLLYTSTPEDVRMIMIDPKMLELSIYEGIPHLLLPVVTDAEKANLALRWAVDEMERRYAMLSKAQVRDIAGYNKKLGELVRQWEGDVKAAKLVAEEAAAAANEDGENAAYGSDLPGVHINADGSQRHVTGELDLPEKPTRLPYIVVIIDEFADLMMVASKEVEQNVARIAAKARAAGIHLILATQRPSVDVITGTIKNNFPSRIAFQVTSDADSRTILDGKGAKQLLGMGDMLHMDRGGEPQRIHGCFVSEDEILKVVKFVKSQAKPVYNMDIVRKRDDGAGAGEDDESVDPLYDKAVQIVAEAQKVSTSMLQRRLNVGYNRAAKIVERMEEQGAIGPSRGTTPREVYVSAA